MIPCDRPDPRVYPVFERIAELFGEPAERPATRVGACRFLMLYERRASMYLRPRDEFEFEILAMEAHGWIDTLEEVQEGLAELKKEAQAREDAARRRENLALARLNLSRAGAAKRREQGKKRAMILRLAAKRSLTRDLASQIARRVGASPQYVRRVLRAHRSPAGE
jgi:hypothetical protein